MFKAEVEGKRFIADTKVMAKDKDQAAKKVLETTPYAREITAIMKG
jgi:hypothetical protein